MIVFRAPMVKREELCMYCRNCGKRTEGDETLCSSCAKDGSSERSDFGFDSDDSFDLSNPDSEVPQRSSRKASRKAPKGKGGLIVAVIALVVVVAVVGIVLNLNRVGAMFARTFQSPEEYLANVESDAIAEHTSKLTQAYGKSLNAYDPSLTASSADIRLTLGDGLLAVAQTALQQQGVNIDVNWLKEIALSVETNVQDKGVQMGLGLGLGKTDVVSADVIVDANGGKAYFAIPELNSNYLYTDISYALSSVNFSQMLEQTTEMYEDLIKSLPSEEDLNAMIDTYSGIVLSGIEKVEKEKDTVTINGVSQKMVVLNAKIKEEEMLDMAIEVLEEAEKDKTLKKLMTAFSDYVNEMNAMQYSGYVPTDLYQEFRNNIPYMIQELEDMKTYADSGNYVKLKIYVDMTGKVRGHELVGYEDGEKVPMPIRWLTVADGDMVYTEAEIGTVEISGEMEEKKGVSSGSYDMTAEGVKIGKLEFSNVTETSGTLRLIPSEEILHEMMNSSGIPVTMLGNKLVLEMSFAAPSEHAGSFEVNILADSRTLVGIAVDVEATSGGKISIPSNALNGDDQVNVDQWILGMNFENVLSALERANVPKELLDLARSYLSMLAYY